MTLNLNLKKPDFDGFLFIFKPLLSETFEPPNLGFRSLSELLEIEQSERNVYAYAQHVRYLLNCVVENPVSIFVLITMTI